MLLNLKKYTAYLLAILILLWFVNVAVFKFISKTHIVPQNILLNSYIFLAVLNIIHFAGLKILFKKQAKQIGFIFMAASFLKMGVSVLFIFVYIVSNTVDSILATMNFMTIYLVLLAYEVIFILKNMIKIR
jgi:hypothetical protein